MVTRKERVAEHKQRRTRGEICDERSFHRYHSSFGDDVEIHDVCLDCGLPAAVEKRFAPHITTWDDPNHTASTVCVGDGRALVAKNEVELLAAMTRAVIE